MECRGLSAELLSVFCLCSRSMSVLHTPTPAHRGDHYIFHEVICGIDSFFHSLQCSKRRKKRERRASHMCVCVCVCVCVKSCMSMYDYLITAHKHVSPMPELHARSKFRDLLVVHHYLSTTSQWPFKHT